MTNAGNCHSLKISVNGGLAMIDRVGGAAGCGDVPNALRMTQSNASAESADSILEENNLVVISSPVQFGNDKMAKFLIDSKADAKTVDFLLKHINDAIEKVVDNLKPSEYEIKLRKERVERMRKLAVELRELQEELENKILEAKHLLERSEDIIEAKELQSEHYI